MKKTRIMATHACPFFIVFKKAIKITLSPAKYKISTPTCIIGIYGTEFIVDVSNSGDSVISLKTGKIKITAISGKKK